MAHKSLLTDAQVKEIRRLHACGGATLTAIAGQFERDVKTVYQIVRGRTYRHVAPDAAVLHAQRREENDRRGRVAEALGVCVYCGDEVTVRVSVLLARPGLVKCGPCRVRGITR